MGLPRTLCEYLLIRDVLVSDLMSLVPVALESVTVTIFSGDIFILFSVVSVALELMPTLCGNTLVLISVASMAVDGVAKLAGHVLRGPRDACIVVPVAGTWPGPSPLLGHGRGEEQARCSSPKERSVQPWPKVAHGDGQAAELLPGLAPAASVAV